MKEQAQGKLLGDTSDGKGIEVPISSNASFEEWMNSVKEQLANLKIDPIEIPIETTNKDVKGHCQGSQHDSRRGTVSVMPSMPLKTLLQRSWAL